MQDRAYIVQTAGHGSAADYDLVAIPRGALPIATVLAIFNAVIQYGPQFVTLVQAIIAAFKPVVPTPTPQPTPTPVPPGPVPTPTPGPIPSI